MRRQLGAWRSGTASSQPLELRRTGPWGRRKRTAALQGVPSIQDAARAGDSAYIRDLGRALGGALLFSLPLLMKMELRALLGPRGSASQPRMRSGAGPQGAEECARLPPKPHAVDGGNRGGGFFWEIGYSALGKGAEGLLRRRRPVSEVAFKNGRSREDETISEGGVGNERGRGDEGEDSCDMKIPPLHQHGVPLGHSPSRG